VCASPWLLSLMRERYGRDGSVFRLSVDHEAYRPRAVARRDDTVVFYVRQGTPRRAGPLGMLALAELHRRRPDVRIVLFGDAIAPPATFPVEVAGVATPTELSWLYSEATVGLCLSLTNYSLVTQEMLACGLPCVDLAGIANEGVFGADGPVGLVDPDPVAIADALVALLGDPAERRRRARAGLRLASGLSWQAAAGQVESGLRDALRARERAAQL
jgi:O-antigen biosynthesis protein